MDEEEEVEKEEEKEGDEGFESVGSVEEDPVRLFKETRILPQFVFLQSRSVVEVSETKPFVPPVLPVVLSVVPSVVSDAPEEIEDGEDVTNQEDEENITVPVVRYNDVPLVLRTRPGPQDDEEIIQAFSPDLLARQNLLWSGFVHREIFGRSNTWNEWKTSWDLGATTRNSTSFIMQDDQISLHRFCPPPHPPLVNEEGEEENQVIDLSSSVISVFSPSPMNRDKYVREDAVFGMLWSPDLRSSSVERAQTALLLSSTRRGEIRLWDIHPDRERENINGFVNNPEDPLARRKAKELCRGPLAQWTLPFAEVEDLQWIPGGSPSSSFSSSKLAVVSSSSRDILIYDTVSLDGERVVSPLQKISRPKGKGSGGHFCVHSFIPLGSSSPLLATGDREGLIYLWDLRAPKPAIQTPSKPAPVQRLPSFSDFEDMYGKSDADQTPSSSSSSSSFFSGQGEKNGERSAEPKTKMEILYSSSLTDSKIEAIYSLGSDPEGKVLFSGTEHGSLMGWDLRYIKARSSLWNVNSNRPRVGDDINDRTSIINAKYGADHSILCHHGNGSISSFSPFSRSFRSLWSPSSTFDRICMDRFPERRRNTFAVRDSTSIVIDEPRSESVRVLLSHSSFHSLDSALLPLPPGSGPVFSIATHPSPQTIPYIAVGLTDHRFCLLRPSH